MKKKPEQKNENKINYLHDGFIIDAKSIIKDEAGEVSKFTARVQQADTVNLNRRIYPADVLKEAVDAYKKKIDAKQAFVLIDHPGWFGGSFDRVGALITDIWFDESDKFVYIEGKFVKNDNFAKHIQPIVDAGGALPFSARGYCLNDGNPEWSDEKQAFIFRKGYRLASYDFVVDPAMEEATTVSMEQREEQADKNHTSKPNNLKEEQRMFKTVDELRAEYPSLVKQLDDQIGNFKKVNDEANAELASAKKQLESVSAELVAKTDALNKATAELAKSKFDADVKELMKDHKYATFIKVPATVTTIEDAKAYVEAETAKLDAFKAAMAPKENTDASKEKETKEVKDAKIVNEDNPATVNALDNLIGDNKLVDEYDRMARA